MAAIIATTIKTINPVGKLSCVLNKSLYQPSPVPRNGNVTLCTFDTIELKPREIIIVPSVAMNGGNPNFAIKIPLNNPNTPPITNIANNASHNGQPIFVWSTPPTMAEHIITVPIDKSIPPVIITNVTPIAKKPM